VIENISRFFLNRQFVLFLFAGGTAALLQWISRILFSSYVSYGVAVPLAYVVGLVTAYTLNILFVFKKSANSRRREILYFIGVNLVGLPIVWIVSVFLGAVMLPRFMARPTAEALGNAIGILSPVLLSFVLHKTVTFRDQAP